MARKRRVTLRSQWLGKMLRELRLENDLTLKEVSDYARRDFSTLSRFESGVQPIPRDDLLELMDLYGVEGDNQRRALLQLSEEQTKTGWWERYAKQSTDWFMDYVWVESRAQQIRSYDVTPVNGLLQTREYAEAWMRMTSPNLSSSHLERSVQLRMSRQEILQGENPVQLSLVMDESTLHRTVGGTEVMRSQLQQLLRQSEEPNIEIRVLPLAGGEHPSPDGGFSLIQMEEPYPLVAYTLGPAGGLFLEADQADQLDSLYGRIVQHSLDVDASARKIADAEKSLT